MSITVRYVKDSPHVARYQEASVNVGKTYLVGDMVISGTSTTDVDVYYKCTTAGVAPSSGAFNPVGAATYNWGTTVWTKITTPSTGWADASPVAFKNGTLTYVDCEARFVAASDTSAGADGYYMPLAVVFVNPATMLPSTGRVGGTTGDLLTASANYFFGNCSGSGFHTRDRFGVTNSLGGVAIDCQAVNPTLGPAVTGRGYNIKYTNLSAITVTNIGGVAVNITSTGDSSLTQITPLGANQLDNSGLTFANHLEHASAGTVYGAPGFVSQSADLFSGALAYVSDNTTPVIPTIQGSWGGLKQVTTIYRNSAAPSGEIAQSLQVGTNKAACYATMFTSPFFYVHNTLTGARTLTFHFLTDSPYESDIADADIWVEVFYPSSATTAQYALATSENANWGVPACSRNNLALDAGVTWTYSGIFSPTAYKITVSFTPQRAGMLLVRVNIAGIRLVRYLTYLCPYIDVA